MTAKFASMTLAALLAGAMLAHADLPPGPNATLPPVVPLVSTDGLGAADPAGEITIVVRDLANLPVPNAFITLDFSDCPGVRLCANPADPDAIVNCAQAKVSKISDAQGTVHFRVVGAASASPGSPLAGPSCLRVYGDGVLFGSPRAVTYDLDGGGLSPADLSLWLTGLFAGADDMRLDYDGSGDLGPNDLSMWLQVYFAGGSQGGCAGGTPCP